MGPLTLAVDHQIEIPLSLFIALVTIVLGGLVTFSAWIVKKHIELAGQDIRLAEIQEGMMNQLVMLRESTIEHHERLLYLERQHPSHTEAAHG